MCVKVRIGAPARQSLFNVAGGTLNILDIRQSIRNQMEDLIQESIAEFLMCLNVRHDD